MTVFKPEEIEKIKKKGNTAMFEELMGGWSESINPVPNKTDAHKLKEFFNLKYKVRRFAKKTESESEDSDSDSSTERKKKKKKAATKKKDKKLKKKV